MKGARKKVLTEYQITQRIKMLSSARLAWRRVSSEILPSLDSVVCLDQVIVHRKAEESQLFKEVASKCLYLVNGRRSKFS